MVRRLKRPSASHKINKLSIVKFISIFSLNLVADEKTMLPPPHTGYCYTVTLSSEQWFYRRANLFHFFFLVKSNWQVLITFSSRPQTASLLMYFVAPSAPGARAIDKKVIIILSRRFAPNPTGCRALGTLNESTNSLIEWQIDRLFAQFFNLSIKNVLHRSQRLKPLSFWASSILVIIFFFVRGASQSCQLKLHCRVNVLAKENAFSCNCNAGFGRRCRFRHTFHANFRVCITH